MKKLSTFAILLASLFTANVTTLAPSANAAVVLFLIGEDGENESVGQWAIPSFVAGLGGVIWGAAISDRGGSAIPGIVGFSLMILDIDGSPAQETLVEKLTSLFPFIDDKEALAELATEIKTRAGDLRDSKAALVHVDDETVDAILQSTSLEQRAAVKNYLR
jgi:hypothetical protein